ncbi:DUF4133 domain-containing protein (plasmid) [Mucilaginibacter robiniae]|uniref:DUF4133 domain-containing protein n=1 Tax=Mucilaginibacter robiniae TaxID=2728022 RepID=A0A7L5E8A6_9SPHI|nr:DUF4133 domain-containing protein [Mucilaginibacter robiniae]QJD98559.1 DUF4133 domain-containing protein [Mucilaginibacter robiniae]
MAKQFNIYKGLQKPLIYRGFQGKFIGWGVGALVISLVAGGVIGSLTSMAYGGFICVAGFVGGLIFTAQQQKKGLHFKTRHRGVFRFRTDFRKLTRWHKNAKQSLPYRTSE